MYIIPFLYNVETLKNNPLASLFVSYAVAKYYTDTFVLYPR